MLDSLQMSYSGKLDGTLGKVNVLPNTRSSEDIQTLYKKVLNCCGRASERTLVHRPLQPKYHISGVVVQSLRKHSLVRTPLCLADSSSELAKWVVGKSSRGAPHGSTSSTLRETAAEACIESHEIASAVKSSGPHDPLWGRNYPFNHANTVGILGGMSPVATVDFMRKIVDATRSQDDIDHIPLVLCSDPYIGKIVSPGPSLMPATARNAGVSAATGLPGSGSGDIDFHSSLKALLANRQFLERAGAKCIVMPCHSSHLWYDQLAEGCSVPFLHMADCVIEELKAADLKPLEGGSEPKIGVLGTEFNFGAKFYPEKLRSQGFDVVLPDIATMEHAVIPGIAALHRGDLEGARNLLRIAVQVLLVNAANVVLLACHYTRTVFPADDPVLRKCVDPTDALVRATVEWCRSVKRE